MPKRTFLQLVEDKGYPTRIVRYCCEALKEYATPGYDKTIIGVRRSESRQRAERYKEPTQCIGTKKQPHEAIYPLLDWTDDDIAAFIADRGIKCHPLYYDEHGRFHPERRLGCIACPLTYKKKRIEEFRQYPNMVKAWLRAGQKYRDKHPDYVRVRQNADVYEWFVRELFFGTNEAWQSEVESWALFGKPDYKTFLEDFFHIDLTLRNS